MNVWAKQCNLKKSRKFMRIYIKNQLENSNFPQKSIGQLWFSVEIWWIFIGIHSAFAPTGYYPEWLVRLRCNGFLEIFLALFPRISQEHKLRHTGRYRPEHPNRKHRCRKTRDFSYEAIIMELPKILRKWNI